MRQKMEISRNAVANCIKDGNKICIQDETGNKYRKSYRRHLIAQALQYVEGLERCTTFRGMITSFLIAQKSLPSIAK